MKIDWKKVWDKFEKLTDDDKPYVPWGSQKDLIQELVEKQLKPKRRK